MGMPKGMKHTYGYATVTGEGRGYREIAEAMTEKGFKMNHASARNYFIRAMRKLAKPVSAVFPDRELEEIAADPRFQSAIADIIRDNDGIDI